jgi:hypothetical protein
MVVPEIESPGASQALVKSVVLGAGKTGDEIGTVYATSVQTSSKNSRRNAMADPKTPDLPPAKDQLMTRPEEAPLPTPLDPAGPESRGGATDPKPGNERSPGHPTATKEGSEDLTRLT